MATTGAMKTGARTSKRVLKIVSKCSNEAEFIAVFQRFCTGDSLFVVTKTPKPVGAESRLAITLSSGKPMIVGDGKVTQSFNDGTDNPFGRPGMKIRLVGLDGDSATMMNKLNAARTAFELKKAAGKDGADAQPGKNGSNGIGRKTMMGTAPAPKPQMKIPEIPVKKPAGPLERPKVKPEATPPPTLTPAKADAGKPKADAGKPKADAGKPPAAIGKLRERLPSRPPDADAPSAKPGVPAVPPKSDAKAPAAAAIPERVDSSDNTVPVPVDKPKPKLAAIPLRDPDGDGFGDEEEITQVSAHEEARLATGDSPTGESRVEGSEFILPANPFGELTEQSLEAFVECTIYEESRPATVDGEGDEEFPAWWPESGGEGTTTPLPPAAPGMLPAGEMTAEVRRDPTPPPVAAGQQAAMLASAAAVPPASEVMPALPVSRRSSWMPLAVTAFATAALTLVLAYFLFGGGGDGDDPAPATVAASEAATPSTTTPAKTEPAPAPAAAATTDDDEGEAGNGDGDGDGDGDEEADVADSADDTAGAEAATAPPAAAETEDQDGEGDDGNSEGEADGDGDGDEEAEEADEETDTADLDAGACGLALTTSTDNARAYLDGRYLGRIPLEEQVPCDGKLLEVKHPRYDDYKRRIALTEGSTKRMRVGLRRPTFQLRVVTYPSGATAYLGGRRIGRTPLTTKVSGFQRKTLKLVRKGYKPVKKRLYPKRRLTLVREKMEPSR